MKVAYLVAGAGGMYCGSCMRDNRLARAMIAQGHDVALIPLYTPIRTDEEDISGPRIFYGGINAFLQQKSALFRHLPAFVERWLDAPSLLKHVGRLAAKTRPEDLGALTVSVLRGEQGLQRRELTKLIAGLRAIEPAIVNLPNLMFVGVARALKKALNVSVVCALAGEDIFLDALPQPYRGQAFDLIARAVPDVDAFIAPTRYYAAHATEHFAIPRDRVHFVPMGVHVEDFKTQSERSGNPSGASTEPFTIGYLARICPEKGLEVLCESFARLRAAGRKCRLRVAGYLGPADRPYLDRVRASLSTAGVGHDFEHVGEVDRAQKIEFLQSLDVLSVPTVYAESKGFFVLEAMACGVPVVQPRKGSFPEMVEATGGGLLYDPHESGALEAALSRLMDDEPLRRRLAADGCTAVRKSFNDRVMAEQTWSIYRKFL